MGYHRFNSLCVIRAGGLKMLWVTVLSGLEVHPENWYTLKKSTPYLTKKSALKVSTPPKISTLQLGIVKARVIILLQCAL